MLPQMHGLIRLGRGGCGSVAAPWQSLLAQLRPGLCGAATALINREGRKKLQEPPKGVRKARPRLCGGEKLAVPIRERHNEGVSYGMGQSVCPQCSSSADVRTVAELFAMLGGTQGGATQQPYPGQQQYPDQQPGQAYPDYPTYQVPGYEIPTYQAPGDQAPGNQAPGNQDPGNQGPGNQGSSNQGQGSTDSNSDHPYQSYQGPGIPTAGAQPQRSGPAPGYQGPDYPSQQRRPSFGDIDFGGGGDDLVGEIGGAVLGAAIKFAGRGIGKRMQKAFEEKVAPAVAARAAQARQQWQPSGDDQAAIVQRYPDLRGCMRDQVLFLDGRRTTVPITEIRMPVTLAQADAIVGRLRTQP
jgi:hypothetical protein